MRTNSFSIKIDNAPVDALAGRVEALANRALLRLSAVDAVNEVAARFDAAARKGMNAGLNLSDAYIAERMTLARAVSTGRTVRAEIVAQGPKPGLTIMGHYPVEQRRGTNGVRGQRASGVGVEITKGAAKIVDKWFLMRLRNSGKMGVFYRPQGGKPVHKYGPSPYSLFRHQIDTRGDDLAADLSATVASRAADAIQKALA